MYNSEQDETVSPLEEATQILADTSAAAAVRIGRVQRTLEDSDHGVPDALVALATTGDEHVLAGEQRRYVAFLELCNAAAEQGHDVSTQAVFSRSLASHSNPEQLESAIRSNEQLNDEQKSDRVARLQSARSSGDDDPAGEVSEPAPDERADTAHALSEGTVGDEVAGATSAFEGVSTATDDGASSDEDTRSVPDLFQQSSKESPGVDDGSSEESRDGDETPSEGNSPGPAPEVGSDESEATPDAQSDDGSTARSTDQSTPGSDSLESDQTLESSGMVGSAPGQAHRETLDPPQRTDPTEQGALSMPNYAQDLLNFEFVFERNDDLAPTGVEPSGMIVVDEKEYVGIVRVKPRSWSIHTDEKKAEIIEGYRSVFLATLDFPVQIVSYPTKFDISDHVKRLETVVDEGQTRSSDSDLVNYGRQLYPNWLERFIRDNDMKQRQLYIVVSISVDQINEFQTANEGILHSLADKVPPLQPLADRFSEDNVDISKQQCLRELDSRITRIGSGLRRFDVEVERLRDRNEVLSVLYHYYNNEQPLNDAFPTGPYSEDAGEMGEGR